MSQDQYSPEQKEDLRKSSLFAGLAVFTFVIVIISVGFRNIVAVFLFWIASVAFSIVVRERNKALKWPEVKCPKCKKIGRPLSAQNVLLGTPLTVLIPPLGILYFLWKPPYKCSFCGNTKNLEKILKENNIKNGRDNKEKLN